VGGGDEARRIVGDLGEARPVGLDDQGRGGDGGGGRAGQPGQLMRRCRRVAIAGGHDRLSRSLCTLTIIATSRRHTFSTTSMIWLPSRSAGAAPGRPAGGASAQV